MQLKKKKLCERITVLSLNLTQITSPVYLCIAKKKKKIWWRSGYVILRIQLTVCTNHANIAEHFLIKIITHIICM